MIGVARVLALLEPSVALIEQVEGFGLHHQDGTPAAILEQLRPGATGLLVVDPDKAQGLIEAMPTTPDELALLFLGHRCPCQAECPGVIHFPAAMRSTGDQVLLAGCLHNYGSVSIHALLGRMLRCACLTSSIASLKSGLRIMSR